MSAETTSNVVERMKGRGAGADRPRVVFRTDWKRATRRLIVGGLCAVTAASLTFPSAAMAAEWVNVGGTHYDAAAGDETWSWDGANDMQLKGYNGGSIEAAGHLDLTYEGDNTVTNSDGEGISVVNGVTRAPSSTSRAEPMTASPWTRRVTPSSLRVASTSPETAPSPPRPRAPTA